MPGDEKADVPKEAELTRRRASLRVQAKAGQGFLPGFGAGIAEDSGGGAVVGKKGQADRFRGSLFDRPGSAMLIHIGRRIAGIG